jgi:EmrB/QacA subfamily drug resistance transporter
LAVFLRLKTKKRSPLNITAGEDQSPFFDPINPLIWKIPVMTIPGHQPCDHTVAGAQSSCITFHPTATLVTCILGSSLAFIDGSVVNVALPSLGQSLHASAGSLSWVISAYLLPLSAMTLLGGAIGDHYGRRRFFIIGITIFLLASLLCAITPNVTGLIISRVMQGTGAALLMPNSLALLGVSFEGEAKGRAIGTWAGVGALASALGPLLGGWLVDEVGWRTIFLINLPVGLCAIFLAWRYVAENRDNQSNLSLDWTGAIFVTIGLGLLTWGLTDWAEQHASAISFVSALSAGAFSLAGFIFIQIRKGKNALMPLYLMTGSVFLGVTLFTFFLYAALGGLLILLPYLLIRVENYTAVQAGAAMLPIPVLIGIGSGIMGRVAARVGGKIPLGIGSLLVAAGLLLYLRIGEGYTNYWRDIFPGTMMVACGMAVSVAPLTTTVINCVDKIHVGIASGFNSAVARIGGLLATAMLTFVIVGQGSREEFLHGFHRASIVGALLTMAAAFCSFLLINRKTMPAN